MGHHKTPTKEAAELSSYSKRHMVKTGQKMGHHSVQILFKFCSNSVQISHSSDRQLTPIDSYTLKQPICIAFFKPSTLSCSLPFLTYSHSAKTLQNGVIKGATDGDGGRGQLLRRRNGRSPKSRLVFV